MPDAMVKQLEREQIRNKLEKKGPKKASANSEAEIETVTAGAVPTVTPSATSTQPAVQNVQNVQPAVPLSQVPIQPQGFPLFNPPIIQPHSIAAFSQYPGFVPNVQSPQQYITPMFVQNPGPYNPFGYGFQDPPMYPQNSHRFYPTVGSYQPTRDNTFSTPTPLHPTPPESHFFQPRTRHTNLHEPPHRQDFTIRESGWLPTQPVPGSSRNRFSRYDPSDDYDGNPTQFPALQEWFVSVDNHPQRGIYGDEFSQYSHAFDLRGLRTLIDLKGLKPVQLFEQFGFSESSAHRLLKFAEEDIRSIQSNANNY